VGLSVGGVDSREKSRSAWKGRAGVHGRQDNRTLGRHSKKLLRAVLGQGSGFRVQGSEIMVQGARFRSQSQPWVQGLYDVAV